MIFRMFVLTGRKEGKIIKKLLWLIEQTNFLGYVDGFCLFYSWPMLLSLAVVDNFVSW